MRVLVFFLIAASLPAQIANMQEIAQGLGVKCEYCHAGMGRGAAQRVDPAAPKAEGQTPSRIDIGRAMIAMTRDINEKILLATGKPPTDVTRVTCITCHRGVAIPGQLSDIVAKTALEKGPMRPSRNTANCSRSTTAARAMISARRRC